MTFLAKKMRPKPNMQRNDTNIALGGEGCGAENSKICQTDLCSIAGGR